MHKKGRERAGSKRKSAVQVKISLHRAFLFAHTSRTVKKLTGQKTVGKGRGYTALDISQSHQSR